MRRGCRRRRQYRLPPPPFVVASQRPRSAPDTNAIGCSWQAGQDATVTYPRHDTRHCRPRPPPPTATTAKCQTKAQATVQARAAAYAWLVAGPVLLAPKGYRPFLVDAEAFGVQNAGAAGASALAPTVTAETATSAARAAAMHPARVQAGRAEMPPGAAGDRPPAYAAGHNPHVGPTTTAAAPGLGTSSAVGARDARFKGRARFFVRLARPHGRSPSDTAAPPGRSQPCPPRPRLIVTVMGGLSTKRQPVTGHQPARHAGSLEESTACIQRIVTASEGTKGLFHAFRRMKKDFSLLFQALFGHEKIQNWSLWHGYSQKKKRRSKGSVELRYAPVFLCASRMSPFSPSLPMRNGF